MQQIQLVPKVIFGQGAMDYLEGISSQQVALITDSFIASLPSFENMVKRLSSKNQVTVYKDVVPDPPIEQIVAGIHLLEAAKPTVLIAIGGGSPIDAAKGILYFATKTQADLKRKDILFIAIPTTSGTGSEVTNFAVITDAEKGLKYPLVEEEILPDVALLDTELVMDLPAKITADTGVDVLTHAIEAYVSNKATPFSDALAQKAIELVFANLANAYKQGHQDPLARENMHVASTLAGMAFNAASLGINHSLAHALGGKFHLAHGRINGVLLTKVIAYNAGLMDRNTGPDCKRAMERYGQIAGMVGVTVTNPNLAVPSLCRKIDQLLSQVGIPKGFSQLGIDSADYQEQLDAIASAALEDRCTPTNPRVPTKDQLVMILKGCY